MNAAGPWMFGLAIIVLGFVMFSIPEDTVFPLSVIFIFGTLLAANRDAAKRNVKDPISELLGESK